MSTRPSVYADDITISGNLVPKKLIWDVEKILHRHAHKPKKSKQRSKFNTPAEITGVIVSKSALHAPKRQHKKLRDVTCEFALESFPESKEKLAARIAGRKAQLRQILAATPID